MTHQNRKASNQNHLQRVLAIMSASLIFCSCTDHKTDAKGDAADMRADHVSEERVSSTELARIKTVLSDAVEYEMDLRDVDGMSLALVANGQPIWAQGFGYADASQKMPASADTIYRVGSISKLFTGIVIMQLVDEGVLDLDAPVTAYLPDFAPKNSYATPVTLRHLLAQRSGVVREPPVGHYFDDSGATLAQTVASLNQTSIQVEPGSRYKYSNAGIAVAGLVIEEVTGESFDDVVNSRILKPLGMTSSAFHLPPSLEERSAKGIMTSYDDPRSEAPRYDLGEAPAGNLFSSVEDLSTFITALLNPSKTLDEDHPISVALLEEMWTPQGGEEDERMFGLSFILDEIDGARRVGHSGAVYGFVADMRAAPDNNLGVAIAANLDQYSVWKLSDYAMALLIAAEGDEPFPEYGKTQSPSEELIDAVKGSYRGEDELLILRKHLSITGELRLFVEGEEEIGELRRLGSNWVYEIGAKSYAASFDGPRLTLDGRVYERAELSKPAPVSPAYAGLIGQYGWKHDYIRFYEWNGRPHIRIEWRHHHEMTPLSDDVFAFPDSGFYPLEKVRFERDENGEGVAVTLNGVRFPRRRFGEEFQDYMQEIMRPSDALVEQALSAEPPVQEGDFLPPDLVDLRVIDPTIKPSLAYATSDNLFGFPTYGDDAKPVMQRRAAQALAQVSRTLRPLGYGLMIHDAYRPWYVTKIFWDATPSEGKNYVADPAQGSRHNRGSAVDLTLYDLASGERVEMAAGLDEVSMRSHFAFIGGTDLQRWRRDLLHDTMVENGFTVYPVEWWHYDHKDWSRFPVLNVKFEDME